MPIVKLRTISSFPAFSRVISLSFIFSYQISRYTCGGTFWHKVCQGIVPTCLTQFIAWFLYCIELNIRASTIVGMVGGGGIGLVLFSYIKSFNYAGAAGIILVIAAMVIMVEFLTNYLRRKVLT